MSGIILLLALAIWFFMVKKISGYFVRRMRSGEKKVIIQTVIVICLFVAPLIDEIIGGFQFRELCGSENLLIYDAEKLRGKVVSHGDISVKTINKILPIVVTTGRWVDSSTGELLVTRKILRAKGGWLSRSIGFPQGSPPYIFNGVCSSKEYYRLFENLEVTELKN